MIGWFRKGRQRRPDQDGEIDALRNAAVGAWIKTFPNEDRLSSFLDGVRAELRDDVRLSAARLRDAAHDYLDQWGKPIGEDGLEGFVASLHEHLKARCPWMNDAAWQSIRSYMSWFIWHEGY